MSIYIYMHISTTCLSFCVAPFHIITYIFDSKHLTNIAPFFPLNIDSIFRDLRTISAEMLEVTMGQTHRLKESQALVYESFFWQHGIISSYTPEDQKHELENRGPPGKGDSNSKKPFAGSMLNFQGVGNSLISWFLKPCLGENVTIIRKKHKKHISSFLTTGCGYENLGEGLLTRFPSKKLNPKLETFCGCQVENTLWEMYEKLPSATWQKKLRVVEIVFLPYTIIMSFWQI